MVGKTSEEGQDAELLSRAMRLVRKQRRMRTSEVARALGMPIRSYEHFEAGRGKISFDRILRFAEATNSDPIAFLAVLALQRPDVAVHCADNKLMTVMMMAMGELEEELGADIAYLSSASAVTAFTRLVREIVENVRRQDNFAEHWRSGSAPRPVGALLPGWRRRPQR